jgi:ribosomal protein S27AE
VRLWPLQWEVYWPGSITRCPECKKITWANHWTSDYWECSRCGGEWWIS